MYSILSESYICTYTYIYIHTILHNTYSACYVYIYIYLLHIHIYICIRTYVYSSNSKDSDAVGVGLPCFWVAPAALMAESRSIVPEPIDPKAWKVWYFWDHGNTSLNEPLDVSWVFLMYSECSRCIPHMIEYHWVKAYQKITHETSGKIAVEGF